MLGSFGSCSYFLTLLVLPYRRLVNQ